VKLLVRAVFAALVSLGLFALGGGVSALERESVSKMELLLFGLSFKMLGPVMFEFIRSSIASSGVD